MLLSNRTCRTYRLYRPRRSQRCLRPRHLPGRPTARCAFHCIAGIDTEPPAAQILSVQVVVGMLMVEYDERVESGGLNYRK